jgi:FtsP/CotA-like multicopper oxidase with cupredoxin domain
VIDGGPEAYFLSDQAGDPNGPTVVNIHGPAYYSKAGAADNEAIYRYPNTQEASPLWFHDHLLGGTRLNATFGGLAGAYAVIDPDLELPSGLHPVGLQNADETNLRYTIPLVIQDRMFDTNGQLYFPNTGINPEHPYWIPEFVGDVIVVNGKAWPYLNVDQQRYRFYLINGSNSTPYEMFLQDLDHKVSGPRFWVIATDGGYLDTPVLIDPNASGAQIKAGVQKTLVMMPGERYEIIIDFNDQVWKNQILPKRAKFPLNLVLRNIAPTVEGNPPSSTVGRLMQFRVSATAPADTSYDPASGTPIRSSEQVIKRLADPATGTLNPNIGSHKTRELALVEIAGPGGPLEVLVNNTRWNGIREGTETPVPDSTFVAGTLFGGNYLTELPNEGDTEVWEIVNTTMDSHPIHLHAIQFQILNRQPYDAAGFFAAYSAAFPGGAFIPGYGPPLGYSPSLASGGKYGGNPNVDPFLVAGAAVPPLNYEAGWKDTAIMHPGEVTRIAVRFAPQDLAVGTVGSFTFDPSALNGVYVWHCHITDHEDNEMMRPYQIISNGATRTYAEGIDY